MATRTSGQRPQACHSRPRFGLPDRPGHGDMRDSQSHRLPSRCNQDRRCAGQTERLSALVRTGVSAQPAAPRRHGPCRCDHALAALGQAGLARHSVSLPPVAAGHWWQRCREIPGRYLSTATGNERFLFYEGASCCDPTVTTSLWRNELTCYNHHGKQLDGPVVVIVNDAGAIRFAAQTLSGTWFKTQRSSPAFQDGGEHGEALLAACRAQWETCGMNADEARMIVDVWREDLLKRPGFLVISRMEPADYEAMFPLTITPKPDQLVRVGLVFDTLPTVSAADRLAWLPRLSVAMSQWAAALAGADGPQRNEAITELAHVGDLARPLLDRLRVGSDARVRAAVLDLLGRLQPPTVIETQAQKPDGINVEQLGEPAKSPVTP